jgi:hypothetical protein
MRNFYDQSCLQNYIIWDVKVWIPRLFNFLNYEINLHITKNSVPTRQKIQCVLISQTIRFLLSGDKIFMGKLYVSFLNKIKYLNIFINNCSSMSITNLMCDIICGFSRTRLNVEVDIAAFNDVVTWQRRLIWGIV